MTCYFPHAFVSYILKCKVISLNNDRKNVFCHGNLKNMLLYCPVLHQETLYNRLRVRVDVVILPAQLAVISSTYTEIINNHFIQL